MEVKINIFEVRVANTEQKFANIYLPKPVKQGLRLASKITNLTKCLIYAIWATRIGFAICVWCQQRFHTDELLLSKTAKPD